MESHLPSRIPLSVTKRLKYFPRDPLGSISLNQQICDSTMNTKQWTVSRIPCQCFLAAKEAPKPKQPALDDYKARFKILLEKYEMLKNKSAVADSELKCYQEKHGILENKLSAAEAEVKSIRQELKRTNTRNKSNEITIEILQRKIADLRVRETGECEDIPSSRFGRIIRQTVKYQSNSS